MARIDTLANYITDISNAVREKTGKTDLIQASELDTEIASIEVGVDINDYFTNTIPSGTYGATGIVKSIKKIPNDISVTESCSYMFSGCSNLEEVPLFDTSNTINMTNMFAYCTKLVSIPQFNTSKVGNMSNIFDSCSGLIEIPLLDISNVTNISNAFYACTKLQKVPQLNGGKLTSISNIFYQCTNLTNLGGIKDLGKAYLTTRAENYSSYRLDLSFCRNLTHESLMNVINNLYDIKTAGCNNQQLILGSINKAKLTEEEIAIATNKGWNVS